MSSHAGRQSDEALAGFIANGGNPTVSHDPTILELAVAIKGSSITLVEPMLVDHEGIADNGGTRGKPNLIVSGTGQRPSALGA